MHDFQRKMHLVDVHKFPKTFDLKQFAHPQKPARFVSRVCLVMFMCDSKQRNNNAHGKRKQEKKLPAALQKDTEPEIEREPTQEEMQVDAEMASLLASKLDGVGERRFAYSYKIPDNFALHGRRRNLQGFKPARAMQNMQKHDDNKPENTPP